jgi:hypothetical protein
MTCAGKSVNSEKKFGNSASSDEEGHSMDAKEMRPPMGDMGMPPMMQDMMQKMMGGMKEINPMAMCQAMMTSVSKSAEMAAYATPEVRTLFEEWAHSVGGEVLTVLKSKGRVDLAELAASLKISPEGALFFVGRLVRDGKASISGIQATEGATEA